MSEFVTLNSTDKEFKSYLWGTFSDQHRALPLKSLNVHTQNERITFQVKPLEDIQSPNFVAKWFLILRLQNWIFCLFPLLLILLKISREKKLTEPWLALLSAGGAFFLFLAMNLRNDVNDHIRGLDRVLPQAGNQAIQKGWVTAQQLQKLSRILFCGGILLGLPAVVAFPELLVLVGALVLLAFWTLTSETFALKYRLIGEFVMFVILGPLLTVGFQISIGAGVDLETLFIGVLSGAVSLFWIHCKNFMYVLENSQAELQNTVSILGFEKAKKFLFGWWMATVLLTVCFKVFYATPMWANIDTILLFLLSFPWVSKLKKCHSPVGSESQSFLLVTQKLTQCWFAVWLLEILGSLLR